MNDHIDQPQEPAKTATELASEGKCCGTCHHFSHFKHGRCRLQDKHVSSFNICERWRDVE